MKHNAEKWADKNGFKWQRIGYHDGGEFKQTGILLTTEYIGAYPPPEVYALHNKIAEYARKSGNEYQAAAMHTGARIIFKKGV